MNPNEIKEILDSHKKWLNTEKDGHRADLSGADLSGADLRGAVLPRNLKLFQAGQWTAIIMPDEILIGCQRHGVARWREFSDEEIARMHHNALHWWRENKALVMAIHASLESTP